MSFATMKLRNAAVVELHVPNFNAGVGARVLETVASLMREGTNVVVLDLAAGTFLDEPGVRVLHVASARLGHAGRLRLSGLDPRGRARFRQIAASSKIAEDVGLYAFWADAVEAIVKHAA
jgi:anti-anti-sigma regulatory factor